MSPTMADFAFLIGGKMLRSFRSEKQAEVECQARRRACLAEHPADKLRVRPDDVIREDNNRMSNEEIIWAEEDLARVRKATRRR